MKEKTTKQLQKEANKLLTEIREREEREIIEVQLPFLKSLVGTCHVYRNNSYGSGSENWDLFRKILDYVEEGSTFHFVYEETSIDAYGRATLLVEERFAYLNKEWHKENPFSGFVPCSLKEYNQAKENTLEEMRSHKKIRAHIKSSK